MCPTFIIIQMASFHKLFISQGQQQGESYINSQEINMDHSQTNIELKNLDPGSAYQVIFNIVLFEGMLTAL